MLANGAVVFEGPRFVGDKLNRFRFATRQPLSRYLELVYFEVVSAAAILEDNSHRLVFLDSDSFWIEGKICAGNRKLARLNWQGAVFHSRAGRVRFGGSDFSHCSLIGGGARLGKIPKAQTGS